MSKVEVENDPDKEERVIWESASAVEEPTL